MQGARSRADWTKKDPADHLIQTTRKTCKVTASVHLGHVCPSHPPIEVKHSAHEALERPVLKIKREARGWTMEATPRHAAIKMLPTFPLTHPYRSCVQRGPRSDHVRQAFRNGEPGIHTTRQGPGRRAKKMTLCSQNRNCGCCCS